MLCCLGSLLSNRVCLLLDYNVYYCSEIFLENNPTLDDSFMHGARCADQLVSFSSQSHGSLSLSHQQCSPPFIMSFRKLYRNLWSKDIAHLRRVEETHACTCRPASEGGDACASEHCHNRGCRTECDPANCPCDEECQNQAIGRGQLPKCQCAPLATPAPLPYKVHALTLVTWWAAQAGGAARQQGQRSPCG